MPGLDAAGAKHLGYDPLWPRRCDSSAHQNGSAIPMPEGGRSQRPKSGSRPPQGMGIASAVSPPGPQRIIAQMLRASGIQTDRSQHYVVATVLQYGNYE